MANTRSDLELRGLIVSEAAELAGALEQRWGVSAAVSVGAMAGQVTVREGFSSESATYDVVLVSIGEQKIAVIREVRALTGLGIGDAKALVEQARGPLLERVSRQEAQRAVARLSEVGATVEVRGNPGDTEILDDDQAVEAAALGILKYAKSVLAPPKEHLATVRVKLNHASER
jgi:large subunit ribosomal protein L7/L12